jgi:hypothetical protein
VANDTEAILERRLDKDRINPYIVNDFSIHVATINGSGSQSSNLVLMRSIMQMGVPASGKNLFPSGNYVRIRQQVPHGQRDQPGNLGYCAGGG